MSCCHYYEYSDQHEQVFNVDVSAIKYGPGALKELGDDARQLSLGRVALFTDKKLVDLEPVALGLQSLKAVGIDVTVYDEVSIEPTDRTFKAATQFAREGQFDGFISIGGGSVIDTCKAANLYSTYPADFLAYVNAPIGEGQAVPGPIKPHIACPTTSGTGSECTGIAVFDLLEQKVKTGIASRLLRPTRAIIDPDCTRTLPGTVVAASGFDVLSHALESYTAVPYSQRKAPDSPSLRPMSQGANPYSDVGCREALKLTGRYLVRAVLDSEDEEARHNMMFAATLAGIAFGNSGVHIPHGMSYSVAGLVRDYYPDDYPKDIPICPHGISVIVNAPAAFRFTAKACPKRHLEAAGLLGAKIERIGPGDEGDYLAQKIIEMMQQTGMPNGITGIGYNDTDIDSLSAGAFAQQRLLKNAPLAVSEQDLHQLYETAMRYW
ncbi:hydroxyacid-oxoacid transhydrogenase [Pseudomonadota bacterium]